MAVMGESLMEYPLMIVFHMKGFGWRMDEKMRWAYDTCPGNVTAEDSINLLVRKVSWVRLARTMWAWMALSSPTLVHLLIAATNEAWSIMGFLWWWSYMGLGLCSYIP